MKIERNIQRIIKVTAREVYEALASKYDLASNPTEVTFEEFEDAEDGVVVLVMTATEVVEQEL